MRKKRGFSLVALVLASVLLIGVYAYLKSRPIEGEDDGDTTKTEPTIEIFNGDRDAINSMILKNKDNEITFIKKIVDLDEEANSEEDKDAEDEEEEKAETEWVCSKPYEVVLSQSTVEDLARTFSSLTAEQIVEEDPKDLSIYGLEDPAATGTAIYDDGTEVVLKLGNKTAEGNTFYLMKEGDPKVYTVYSSHGERLCSSLSDFRDKTLPTIDFDQFNYFLLERKGGQNIEIVTNDNQSEDQAQYGLASYQMIQPYIRPRGVDTSKTETIFSDINSFSIEEFIEDHPDDLVKYGLDEPSIKLVVKDDAGGSLDLVFGDTTDDDMIYFKTNDAESVYSMKKSSVESLDFKAIDIAEKFVLLVNIEDVDKVVIEGRGETHTLSMTRKTIKAEEEDEEDKVETTYFLDGEQKNEDAFKDMYQSTIGITVDNEYYHEPEGIPVLTFTYYLNKGAADREISASFIPYNNDFYSVLMDDDEASDFLISRNRIDGFFYDALDSFKNTAYDPEGD